MKFTQNQVKATSSYHIRSSVFKSYLTMNQTQHQYCIVQYKKRNIIYFKQIQLIVIFKNREADSSSILVITINTTCVSLETFPLEELPLSSFFHLNAN